MMFKKGVIWLFSAVIIFGFMAGLTPGTAAEVSDSDILIIYKDNLTDQQQAGLQTMVKILTYLQHKVVFLPADQGSTVLSDYKQVICYGIDEDAVPLLKQLVSTNQRVFFIGGTAVTAYIQYKGYQIDSVDYQDVIIDAGYSFSEKDFVQSLIQADSVRVLAGNLTYTKGAITSGNIKASLYAGYENFIYMPLMDLNEPVIEASFTNEVALWMWPYTGLPHAYAQYIVLDEVYPFTPPDKLMKIVSYLVDRKLPFIISVMPIYQNGNYPSMERFCEILRYAQDNGATIIMHAPITIHAEDDTEQIWQYLTIATEAYVHYGVYPLAAQLPESYMFQDSGRTVYKRYSTIFWYKQKGSGEDSIQLSDQTNLIFADGHKMIGSVIYLTGTHESLINVHSTAVYIDLDDDMTAIQDKINGCMDSDVPLKNLTEIDNTVYGNSFVLESKDGKIYYNQQRQSMKYEPFVYEENFDYGKNLFKLISLDLAGVSEGLLYLVLGASVLFVLFLVLGRGMLRSRFLKPKKR